MTVIGVAGDWHGNFPAAASRIMSLGARGVATLVHCGDFGIWPGPSGKRFLRDIDRVAARSGVDRVLVCPGNHEDWGRLTQLWASPRRQSDDGRHLPLELSDHVTVLPRGHRWSMGGRSFVALGGAPSVDFGTRTPGVDWWAEEMLEPADVADTIDGGYADVMITHDAPVPATPPVATILATNPLGWSDLALSYAAVGRARVTEAFLGVCPRLLVHGHHHVAGETTVRLPGADYDTTIWSLAADDSAGNLRLLDLDTLREVARPGVRS